MRVKNRSVTKKGCILRACKIYERRKTEKAEMERERQTDRRRQSDRTRDRDREERQRQRERLERDRDNDRDRASDRDVDRDKKKQSHPVSLLAGRSVNTFALTSTSLCACGAAKSAVKCRWNGAAAGRGGRKHVTSSR
jgi:hypothetical protein